MLSIFLNLIRVAERFFSGVPHPHLLGVCCPNIFLWQTHPILLAADEFEEVSVIPASVGLFTFDAALFRERMQGHVIRKDGFGNRKDQPSWLRSNHKFTSTHEFFPIF